VPRPVKLKILTFVNKKKRSTKARSKLREGKIREEKKGVDPRRVLGNAKGRRSLVNGKKKKAQKTGGFLMKNTKGKN